MVYLAHINDDKLEQPLKEHLENTGKLCGKFAESFGMYDWGYCCGLLHDIGKYSLEFQNRLKGSERRVDHSTAGARICWEKDGLYKFLSYCIAGHHAGLPDTGGSSDGSSRGTMYGRMKKDLKSYQKYMEEIAIPVLPPPPFRVTKEENIGILFSMLIRMVFSCLVDADYLDTESFMSNGKTIASLAFALEHAKKHHMDRVIYVIPYTSIIEQNAKIFRDILGNENVLENHCNVDFDSDEELKPMQLAAENWDKPVIVTTNVQFFESLFSNKPSKCRKLHNMANSVIISDEAQMLPSDYLKPCISVMEQLLRHYESSIVLCTATQPSLEGILAGDVPAKELCPRMEEQFQFFRRMSIENAGRISEEELAGKLETGYQVLCILNTKKRAQRIYQRVKGNGVYHLSTSMYPVHRKRVLSEIRERLKEGKRCIVISTSLVEAGVDLDFETVYRQLAGVDSIIQAAGRCNREGQKPAEESVVYVFQFDEREYIPGQKLQMEVTECLLEEKRNLEDLDSIRFYFDMLYHFRGEGLDKKRILERFDRNNFPFTTVGREVKLIEENTKTIFIPREQEAIAIWDELKLKGITKKIMRKMGQYCVNVYERDFDKMFGTGMLKSVSEELGEDFFVLNDLEKYTEDMGLTLEVEQGQAVFF